MKAKKRHRLGGKNNQFNNLLKSYMVTDTMAIKNKDVNY